LMAGCWLDAWWFSLWIKTSFVRRI